MKIIAGTDVLLRAIVEDDPAQARVAVKTLEQAETVAVSVHALCELTWVLQRSYDVARSDIAATIRQLIDTRKVEVNRRAVEAGLAVLDGGGVFADGVIAYEGQWLAAKPLCPSTRTREAVCGPRSSHSTALAHANFSGDLQARATTDTVTPGSGFSYRLRAASMRNFTLVGAYCSRPGRP